VWRLQFEDPAQLEQSTRVEALLLESGCDGSVIYRADVPLDGPGPMPHVLDPGTYGVAALARDARCATIARGCVNVRLPLAADAQILVTLARVDDAPACDISQCLDGRCEGGSEPDAGFIASDGGVLLPDAGPPPGIDGGGAPCTAEREGRCYRVVEVASTWDDAELECGRWGGHLAHFGDEAEERFLDTNVPSRHWIGLTDVAAEGTFRWADGSVFEYSRWQETAPRDTPPWRDCVSSDASGWLDSRCTEELPYVCER